MYKTIRAAGFAALLFVLAAVAVATPKTALAENPQYCDSDIEELTNSDFGDEVPVILVHGLSGGSDDWGSVNDANSFAGHVNDIPDVEVAHIYDYDTLTWWTGNSDAGSKLAKTIDCVARLSEDNGGYGKVIVVGYSQGGLVARQAVSMQSSDGQRAIADQVGQVVTIGTPHNTGNTPNFPTLLTVHTIAGDVTKVYRDIMGNELNRNRPSSDLLVDINSANAARTPNEIEGGGQKTFACEKTYVKKPGWPNWLPEFLIYNTSPAPCEHGQLITDTQNGVREDAALAIKRYVATLVPPTPPTLSLTIGPLTTYYNEESWGDEGYGASGPGENGDIIADDLTSLAEPPEDTSYYANLFMAHTSAWGCNTIECFVQHWGTIVGEAPEITVGGRTPDSSARYESPGRSGIAWCFNDEDICIDYNQRTTEPVYPTQALLDVFETATWSD